MLDGLHSCPCQSGWVIFWGRDVSGCQADSPQVSPSNELWTSCFGQAGQQPSPPLKPAWHRPGSRWPLAAGLACSSVHYRATTEKLTITKISISYPCYEQFVNLDLARKKKSVWRVKRRDMHLYLAWKIVTVSTHITICVTATQCLGFQGHPTQQKMFPPLFNGSLIISKSISPSPLSLSCPHISASPWQPKPSHCPWEDEKMEGAFKWPN